MNNRLLLIQQKRSIIFCTQREAQGIQRDGFFACVSVYLSVTFYYEPCDLVRSIALGMDISELAFKSWRNSLTSLKRAVFCFHMSGFESSTEHCFFRTFRVFSFFGTFRAHPISTSEGSFCVRLLVDQEIRHAMR